MVGSPFHVATGVLFQVAISNPEATTLFITADAGGSNGYQSHAWKHELQQLADETRLTIEVSLLPPGTSK